MVSLIRWIVTKGSCEDSVSTTVDEPGCVETTCENSCLWENYVSPEVRAVLHSADFDRLRRPEVTSGSKGGFNANLRE